MRSHTNLLMFLHEALENLYGHACIQTSQPFASITASRRCGIVLGHLTNTSSRILCQDSRAIRPERNSFQAEVCSRRAQGIAVKVE